MIKIKIYHHNDLDGRAAAAIQYRFDVEARYSEARYFEMEYSKPFPLDQILVDEWIILLDFHCEDEDQFAELKKQAGEILIIDHHKTFKEKVDNNPELYAEVKIMYDGKLSGCEIAWDYYCGPNSPIPRAVKLIGDRDTWRWEFGEETARFCAGMGIHDQEPTNELWRSLFIGNPPSLVNEIIDEGTICLAFRDNFCADYTKSYGFETEFEGYKCFANGIYAFGSEAFGGRMKQYDICLSYEFIGDKWIIGLYSDTIDVSEIAKKHKGGGHCGAAGFTCEELPFRKQVNK